MGDVLTTDSYGMGVLIGMLVAGGLALMVLSIASYMMKGHNPKMARLFCLFAFLGSACIMLGFNFMEQNAASAGDAIVNALSFNGDVAGSSGVETSTAEHFAGALMWVGVAMFLCLIVTAWLFWKKWQCFKQ